MPGASGALSTTQVVEDGGRQGRANALDGGDLLGAGPAQPLNASELLEQGGLPGRPQAGNIVEYGAGHARRALLAVVGDGEAVRLIAQVLEQMKGR